MQSVIHMSIGTILYTLNSHRMRVLEDKGGSNTYCFKHAAREFLSSPASQRLRMANVVQGMQTIEKNGTKTPMLIWYWYNKVYPRQACEMREGGKKQFRVILRWVMIWHRKRNTVPKTRHVRQTFAIIQPAWGQSTTPLTPQRSPSCRWARWWTPLPLWWARWWRTSGRWVVFMLNNCAHLWQRPVFWGFPFYGWS